MARRKKTAGLIEVLRTATMAAADEAGSVRRLAAQCDVPQPMLSRFLNGGRTLALPTVAKLWEFLTNRLFLGVQMPKAESEFKISDIVRLKSGGPKMTVFDVGTVFPGSIGCQWFAGDKLENGRFPVESLVLDTDDEKPSKN